MDSHAHLVFGGDRTREFEARMSGRAYTAGGNRTTVATTRASDDATLRANLHRLAAEALRSGTTAEAVWSAVAGGAKALRRNDIG